MIVSGVGAWPWPRHIEAGFLKTIVDAGAIPHTLAFDLLFTESSNKIDLLESKSGNNDDALLGEAAGLLPSVVTGALSIVPTKDIEEQQIAEARTRTELAQPSLTAPLSNVRGDISKIIGSNVAIFPIRDLRKQSLFGFVNDEPSPIDHIRHTLPLLVRVIDKYIPPWRFRLFAKC